MVVLAYLDPSTVVFCREVDSSGTSKVGELVVYALLLIEFLDQLTRQMAAREH